MTPYFIAPPLPGRGIDIVVRKFEKMDFQYGGNFKKNNVSIRLVKTNGSYVTRHVAYTLRFFKVDHS